MSKIDEDIRSEYLKSKTLFQISKSLGVNPRYVQKIIDTINLNEPKAKSGTEFKCRWAGFGDPSKKHGYVARIRATESWDNDLPEVALARENYEKGTHSLNIGRDGPYLIMYSFIQPVIRPKKNYFELVKEA